MTHREDLLNYRSNKFRAILAGILALLATLTVVAAPAQAKQARLFHGTFGSTTSTTPDPYPLSEPWSLAVDNSAGPSQGDVYVTDPPNHRVEKFDSEGHFVLMFGKEVNKGKVEAGGASEAEENLCAAAEECQPGASGTAPGSFEAEGLQVAVDNSTGPSAGDLYVGDLGNGRNEIDNIKLRPSSLSGSYRLSFEGEQTAPIPVKAEPAQVESALSALPAVGSGNVNVLGEVIENASEVHMSVEFIGSLSFTDVGAITVNPSGLPAEAEVAVSVTSGVSGGPSRVSKFDSEGHLLTSWGVGGRLTGSLAPGGPFYRIGGISVDPQGNLWVLDRHAVHGLNQNPRVFLLRAFEFSQAGSFLSGWNDTTLRQTVLPTPPLTPAVTAAGSTFFREEGNRIVEYSSGGTELGAIPTFVAPAAPEGFTLEGGTEDLFLATQTVNGPPVIERFSSATCHLSLEESCAPDETFGANVLKSEDRYLSVGVDVLSPGHSIYVLDSTQSQVVGFATVTVPDVTTSKASNLTGATARLNGVVDPSGDSLTRCLFEWGEADQPFDHTAPCESPDAAAVGSGEAPVAVHADISGLDATKTYHFRLLASNAAADLAEEPSLGAEHTFGPPKIDAASALSVTSASAILQAQINPQAAPTKYRFEYDTSPYTEGEAPHGTAVPFPDGSAGEGEEQVARNVPIAGLAPRTTYHYRLIVESSIGTAESPDRAFTTQGSPSTLLPDNRGWELVSPAEKHGAPLEAISQEGGVIQAAADGHAITYFARGPVTTDPQGNRSGADSQLLSDRAPTGGWSTADIATAHAQPSGLIPGAGGEYKLFSSDLSLAIVEPYGGTPLSPSTSEKTPYLRQPDGSYLPLVTENNVPPGVHFGGVEVFPEAFENTVVEPRTATPDLSHLLLASRQLLTEEFSPSYHPADYKGPSNIYEWDSGSLRLVSFIPPDPATACRPAGPVCLPAAERGIDAHVGRGDQQVRGAISDDGNRIVFEGNKESAGQHLYLRDLARGESLRLDVAQGVAEPETANAQFQLATPDGSRVFFTSSKRLTADSSAYASDAGGDLYECRIALDSEGHLACALTDVTPQIAGNAADFQGTVIGSAPDGSIYFVANGALTEGEGAVQGNCSGSAKSSGGVGHCNLYRYDPASEETKLIAVLSGADAGDWYAFGGQSLNELTARLSPNGEWLAFMSSRSLTGYDNRDASTGALDQEVFLYHAATGHLVCASCNPTGARPRGRFDTGGFPGLLVDRPGIFGRQTLAGSIPGWTSVNLGSAFYQSRYLSDSGRLFFNAADALVPQDSNGTGDVYEFEPSGVGTCTESDPEFAPSNEGCVSLISSGTSPEESAFMDASESGNDVFFLTKSRLVTKDVDTSIDLYDARVDGGEGEVVKPIECSGDACQQPAVPPNDATPGSLTFNGAGNLVECPKGKVKKNGKCVKKQQKKSKKHRKGKKQNSSKQKGKKHTKKRANTNRGGAK